VGKEIIEHEKKVSNMPTFNLSEVGVINDLPGVAGKLMEARL